MSNRPRPSQTPSRPPTRRQLAAQNREANLQRRVLLWISATIGLALLLIVGGVLYDRLYLPNRTLKQVNNETLTRGEYEQLARGDAIQQMLQTLRFAKLFGATQSFGQGGSFSEQVIQANAQLAIFGTSRSRQQPPDETLISNWVDETLIDQAAREQFQIEPSTGEIDQAILADLGSLISEPVTVTDTATVSETATLTATTDAAASEAATASAAPTATPQPTPTLAQEAATAQVPQVVDALYTEYENIMASLPEEASSQQKQRNMTKDDVLVSLRDQYREQVVRTRVQESLVKEVPAGDASTPDQITARHILLAVPAPTETATPGPDATDVAETPQASAEAAATAEPTPTPTLTPEELDQLFAERKVEADALYQQLIANPDTFADVAREQSDDTGSAQQGGDLEPFNREGQTSSGSTLVQPFVEAAWALQENEISRPVRSEFGWHIIQRLPEDPEAKLERLRNAEFAKWLDGVRQQAQIEPPLTPTPTEVPPVTTETPAETAEPEATTTP